jgi:hypothetical protein
MNRQNFYFWTSAAYSYINQMLLLIGYNRRSTILISWATVLTIVSPQSSVLAHYTYDTELHVEIIELNPLNESIKKTHVSIICTML